MAPSPPERPLPVHPAGEADSLRGRQIAAATTYITRSLQNLVHLPHKVAGVPSKKLRRILAMNQLHLPREGAGVETVLPRQKFRIARPRASAIRTTPAPTQRFRWYGAAGPGSRTATSRPLSLSSILHPPSSLPAPTGLTSGARPLTPAASASRRGGRHP